MANQRPRVTIRFRYNLATGEIEEFIVDDQAVTASEAYHDQVARAVAGCLDRRPQISDAGGRFRGAASTGSEKQSPAAEAKRLLPEEEKH